MVDAMSECAAARNFCIRRKTVNKTANHTAPPGNQRKDRPAALLRTVFQTITSA